MTLRNVFQIWMDLGQKVPFVAHNQRHNWHPQTYYVVRKIEVTEKNWEYYRKTGNLYGKAWGHFYRRGQLLTKDVQVELAGTYEWVLAESGQ